MKLKKNRCFECGSKGPLHNHHVVPKSLGGTCTIPLCLVCHGLVHDKNMVRSAELARQGIIRAKKRGAYNGRPVNEERHAQILALVDDGNSYSQIQQKMSCSRTTISAAKKRRLKRVA